MYRHIEKDEKKLTDGELVSTEWHNEQVMQLHNEIEELKKQVKDYQDKIENGTLLELPCKVGDTVYEVFKYHIPPFIKETKIEKIVITEKGLRLRLARNSVYETAISSLGKTLFLTREEAEKRLEELQNG